MKRLVTKALTILSVMGLLSMANVSDAAVASTMTGRVVHAKNGKAVSHARVRVAHHHKHHKHKKKAKTATANVKHKTSHVGHHTSGGTGSALTNAKGQFTMRHSGSGMVTLVAHKRGAGTGRARVASGSGGVAIALHKRHHGHGATVRAHVKRIKVKAAKKGKIKKVTTATPALVPAPAAAKAK